MMRNRSKFKECLTFFLSALLLPFFACAAFATNPNEEVRVWNNYFAKIFQDADLDLKVDFEYNSDWQMSVWDVGLSNGVPQGLFVAANSIRTDFDHREHKAFMDAQAHHFESNAGYSCAWETLKTLTKNSFTKLECYENGNLTYSAFRNFGTGAAIQIHYEITAKNGLTDYNLIEPIITASSIRLIR